MSQKPEIKTLLPVGTLDDDSDSLQSHWDYIYEPDAIDLSRWCFDETRLSLKYTEALLVILREMAAKMVMMKSSVTTMLATE